ncbi:MAG: molybdenum cofactor biosynthesis protein MoeB [Chloroflexi bacterium]|nr:molybdopterin-synthase adenylyltransferase MoeB [Chloroflexi bacterium CFX1]MCK6567567.1 molybdopterin-synthase adenylyltransferase MoeB [Anaerolineales bacterium]MCQ3952711.1 molybdenum cofactor biosynthesis protein MoeB [Chloroflexota bacterium]MDL1919214.1 molybdopterin-synthase adenylyltransferase MoeB [Chloroflexi bacterium CFX5]NUQ59266.1 molybdopterin-synthase adenylyltransferase MoeB [Anaerolineales bacterium]
MTEELTHEQILRYSRHLLMPEVGLQGQLKLKNSSALVIGTGGLGAPVALYLAAAGVGRIGLVDYDVVDSSNLQRQVIHGTSTVGRLKVESARDRLQDLNPDIQIDAYNEPFTSENALRIAKEYDIIIDGTDNFPTRYLTNDVSVFLGRPNVYGSIFRFDGQVSVFYAKEGPCYRCLFPEPPPPGLVPSCAEGGVLGVLPGTIGTLQATEALKILLGVGEPLTGRLLLYNALDMSFDFVKLKKNPKCRVCGPNADIKELIDYEEFCGVPSHHADDTSAGADWDISPLEMNTRLKLDPGLILLDVREPHELEISAIEGAKNIPLGEVAQRMSELDSAKEMIVFCKRGSRSARAIEILSSAGFKKMKNLKGGINAWAEEVDPSLPLY